MKKILVQTLAALVVPFSLAAKDFSPGAVSKFAVSDGVSATLVGMSGVQWSDFSGTDYFGAKVFVDSNIVDAEKTAGTEMKDDDTWCGPLSDMDALFWMGWAQAKTSYATVDDMANYFRTRPTLLRTWSSAGPGPVEGTYGYDGLFNWFKDETGVNLSSKVTNGVVDNTFASSIRSLLDDGGHVIRLATYFATTSNPKWSWCNAYGGVTHAVLCVGYVADTSKAASDPASLKALFIVDSDNSQSTGAGGASAPNTIAYCPVQWNGSAYKITGIWGETSELCEDYSALAKYTEDALPPTGGDMNSALDNSYLTFGSDRSSAEANSWLEVEVQGDFAHGNSLMAIGDLPAGTWSSITTTVVGPCIVDWGWLCASGSERSALQFYCDDDYKFSASDDASSGIVYESYYVPAGVHKLEWCYLQDDTKTGDGSDIAALDWIGLYYPASFVATSFAVEPPAYDYSEEGMNFYEVGRDVQMPAVDAKWECDYDGNVYGSGTSFRMPMASVEFRAIEAIEEPVDDGTFAFNYNTYSAVTTKGAWNGFIMDDYGSVVGTVEVRAAALKNSKSKVTFTVAMLDKKKFKVKGEMALNLGDGYDCTAVGGGSVILAYFRHQNVWGTIDGYYFDCARDYSADKDAAAAAYIARINAAQASYVMSVLSRPQTGMLEMGNGYVGLSIAVGKKGKTKISGVLPDGNRVNATVYAEADDTGMWIPVWAQVKNGYFGGHILSLNTLRADRDKIGDWHNDKMHSYLIFDDASRVADSQPVPVAAAFYLPSWLTYPTAIDGVPILMSALPSYTSTTAVQFGGNKWNALSNNSCNLKLTYVPKTGLIKGTFMIYTTSNAKYRANVNGAYINGWGNCNGGVKDKVTMPMLIGAL